MPNEEEILAARTAKGGWTKAQLAEWGVPWPPPKGWKERLIEECRLRESSVPNRTSPKTP